jgi:HEAT repeat protein
MLRPIGFAALGTLIVALVWSGLREETSSRGVAASALDAREASALLDDDQGSAIRDERPAAMSDAGTYAAVRLAEIKADPTPWSDVWTWRHEFTAANTRELRREVAALARQVGADSFLAVLAQALASDDPILRVEAARSIATLPESRMVEAMQLGVAAPDPETRQEVMDVIEQLQPHLRAELLRASLLAGGSDVQERAIDMLTDHPSPDYFTVLIEGLRATSGATRQAVEQAIGTIVGESLTDYDIANRWWSENHARYDGMMARME